MVAVFSSIAGQRAAVRTLTQALASGRIHHAYRFEGPSGVGKKRTALAFAQALLCTSSKRGCGECSACKRAATLNAEPPKIPQHPDFIWVQRGLYSGTLLTAKEATGISVEQVRKVVLTRTGYGSHEGQALVIFIEDADELTVSAANALLKTLEEPVPGVHFILHTSRPNRLLDTLRSRTLAVRFGSLPDDALAGLAPILGFDPKVIPLAEGSVERALELSNDDQALGHTQWVNAFERALQTPNLAKGLELTSHLPKDRHEVTALLQVYNQHLAHRARNVSRLSEGGQGDDELPKLAHQYARVEFALEALERNVTSTLAVEALLVELRSL